MSLDRISQLPQPILHHILCFLDTEDVVRTGILSKTWHRTFTSFPIADFCQQSLDVDPSSSGGSITREERIRMFVEFVRKSLQSQCQIYGTIPAFYLSMIEHSPYTSIIEDCIQFSLQNNVKELHLARIQSKTRLVMPQSLLSAKQLIMLNLDQCHLSLPPPTHGVVLPTWSSLRRLYFQHCHIDGQIFQNLASSCPLLETFFLLCVDELGDINLSGLTKLTRVEIHRRSDDARDITVELDAPSLKTFFLSDGVGHCNVDLTACKNLTLLTRSHFSPMFSSKDLTDLIAGLPALKSLSFCWGSDRIKFSSQQLVHLNLQVDELMETDLTGLIAGLPALERLFLRCKCDRIKFSSQRLEKLSLTVDEVMETDLTDLIAGLPALKSLSLECKCERIKFSSQGLEKLSLRVDEVMETDLTDLIAGLPALKSLSLECKCDRIKFSSHLLEDLDLSVSKVVGVSIDAPSLKKFTCSHEMLSSDFFMGRSNPEEVRIAFGSDSPSSLLQLRKFLAGFKQIKRLNLCIFGRMRLLPAESMDISLPTLDGVKHLSIIGGVGSHTVSREDWLALLNGLLSSCQPESLSVNCWAYGKFMTKVFCEELSEMVIGQHCCRDDDHIRCGCHDLRSFRIKQSVVNEDATKFISCDALLKLLPTADLSNSNNVEIHFMLEWVPGPATAREGY